MTRPKHLYQILANFHLTESVKKNKINTELQKVEDAEVKRSPSDHRFDAIHRFEVCSGINIFNFCTSNYQTHMT